MTQSDLTEQQELELLAKRLYVSLNEQRATDGQKYGEHMYAPINLEECRIELGLSPIAALQKEMEQL